MGRTFEFGRTVHPRHLCRLGVNPPKDKRQRRSSGQIKEFTNQPLWQCQPQCFFFTMQRKSRHCHNYEFALISSSLTEGQVTAKMSYRCEAGLLTLIARSRRADSSFSIAFIIAAIDCRVALEINKWIKMRTFTLHVWSGWDYIVVHSVGCAVDSVCQLWTTYPMEGVTREHRVVRLEFQSPKSCWWSTTSVSWWNGMS